MLSVAILEKHKTGLGKLNSRCQLVRHYKCDKLSLHYEWERILERLRRIGIQ